VKICGQGHFTFRPFSLKTHNKLPEKLHFLENFELFYIEKYIKMPENPYFYVPLMGDRRSGEKRGIYTL